MGDLLTRATVWVAVGCYVATCFLLMRGRHPPARWTWTAGLVAFLIHVALAFHFFYDWSHTVAWEETARQTEEMTGSRSGFGIYLNYLFAGVWFCDVSFWWRKGDAAYAGRKKWIRYLVHGFFFLPA